MGMIGALFAKLYLGSSTAICYFVLIDKRQSLIEGKFLYCNRCLMSSFVSLTYSYFVPSFSSLFVFSMFASIFFFKSTV